VAKIIKFESKQKVFDISGVKVGGQPGEYPTVLIGSIFYDGHKIVSDANKGEFDRVKAEGLIKMQEELSDKTGNPFILDVVGSTVEALQKYVEFISETTEAPFLVDAPSATVRILAMKYAVEVGLNARAIYNSIDNTIKQEEIKAIKELGVKTAVLLAYNSRNLWPEGRLEILKGYTNQIGLLEAAKKARVKNLLVDTAVLDIPSIGLAVRSIYLVKQELGLPAGCGPANATTTWKKGKKEYAPYGFPVCNASACTSAQIMGANFILYGPIVQAEAVFPACAMTDALIAYNSRRYGIGPKVKNHPLFKIS